MARKQSRNRGGGATALRAGGGRSGARIAGCRKEGWIRIAVEAEAEGLSLNGWIADVLGKRTRVA